MTDRTVAEKFTAALDALIEDIKQDRSVLAAILCGSLSHDTVWEKSDIDLALVTIDDNKTMQGDRTINADGVNVHAFLVPRTKFRTLVEGTIRNSFMHSLLAKGRLLFTHDDTIVALLERLQSIGQRDTEIQSLHVGSAAIATIHKAHKWLVTRGDLDYSALWILYSATPLAQIEVLSHRMLVDREVIPQAMKLNPEFFKIVYSDLLNTKKTRKGVEAALAAVDTYMADRATKLFAPVLDHLRDVGETRSCTEIDAHFAKNFGIEHVTGICEYLADQGLIGKASTSVQLTKRSTTEVQELAFYSLR
jgi:predicted nucleotidyltransferase